MQIPAADLPSEATGKCDQIAYQYTALIQPHAALIVLDGQTRQVLQASESVQDLLGISASALLGKELSAVGLGAVSDRFDRMRARTIAPHLIGGLVSPSGTPLIGRLQSHDGLILLELEPERHEADPSIESPERVINYIAEAIDEVRSIDDLASSLTSAVRIALGYDRCMLYRFDPEWNGEVIGESRVDHAEDSFLNLRFPARDIPKSARAMFSEAKFRVTVDQSRDFSPLLPRLNPKTGRDIDLTHVRSRGAAGSCQIYYRNMGVRATLIIPITVGEKLWGLISCHHGQALRPSPTLDPYFEFLGRIASSAIERLVLRERAKAEEAVAQFHEHLVHLENSGRRWLDRLWQQIHTLHGLLEAEGFIMRIGEECFAVGKADKQHAPRLLDTLLKNAPREPFATNQIPLEHPELADLAPIAAGAIVVPLSSNPGDAAVWIRGERRLTVNWAGDPTAGLKWDEAGRPELTPRSSFELWKTTTAGTCRPWTSSELTLAKSAAMRIGLLVLSWETAQASRSKSEFLANVSHEIRTPLTAILGFTDILLEDETNPEKREFIAVIQRNGTHLINLINEILDISKVEAGHLEITPAVTNVRELVADVIALMQERAQQKSIQLISTISNEIQQHVTVDPMRLKQILINLVANALKFTEAGSVTISITRPAHSKEILELAVIDTGIGISEDKLDRIFKPFEQADSSTTRLYGGTGLGLTISLRLAEMLGGGITVRSEVGKGSAFHVTVLAPPAHTHTNTPAQHTAPSAHTPAHTPPPHSQSSRNTSPARDASTQAAPLRGTRVLIAEDGPDNRRLLAHFLKSAGAEVHFAENGQQAIDLVAAAAAQPFNLILMDMQMPLMDGYEATRRLRLSGCSTPIIALTAHAMAGDDQRCITCGCDEYLSKPINRAALIERCTYWSRPGSRQTA